MGILVTGGSKGIGRAIAVRLAREGGDVFVNYAHDDDAAKEAAQEIEARGATAHLVKQDTRGAAGAQAVIDEVSQHTDRLETIVHCAVLPGASLAIDIDPEQFMQAIELNGATLLFLTQAARPLLQRGSTVFFLSSRGGKFVVPKYVAIGAGKALGEALVRYLAVELAEDGIRVNSVSPGALLTDAFRNAMANPEERFAQLAEANPSKRNLDFDDVTAAVEFLASPAAGMITGQDLVIDGGISIKT